MSLTVSATIELSQAPTHNVDYDVMVSAVIKRSTAGWIDVQGILIADSTIDVHALLSIEGGSLPSWDIIGAEVQAVLGNAASTPLGGSVYVEAGTYTVSIRAATCAPDATIARRAGTWLLATARD